ALFSGAILSPYIFSMVQFVTISLFSGAIFATNAYFGGAILQQTLILVVQFCNKGCLQPNLIAYVALQIPCFSTL
ncbi:MAG: hypothetical protein WBC91_16160, partial [Phototrophicaceae bacterium]